MDNFLPDDLVNLPLSEKIAIINKVNEKLIYMTQHPDEMQVELATVQFTILKAIFESSSESELEQNLPILLKLKKECEEITSSFTNKSNALKNELAQFKTSQKNIKKYQANGL